MEKFKVDNINAKKRLDVFLTEILNNEYSRSFIHQSITDGFVLVSGKKSKPGYKLKENEEINFTLPPKVILTLEKEDIPLNIIYEDDDIVVVNKQPGMVVHPGTGNNSHTLVNALMFHCKGQLASQGSPSRPGIVHRLDKEVSGVLVVAKTDAAYKALVEQFKERTIVKKYIAVVKGKVALSSGKIELAIGRSSKDRKKMAAGVTNKNAKPAVTYYKVLEKNKDASRLEIRIETGRTHQIRVHMSYLGHPILGDVKYGGPKYKRLMLHALSLQFKHPVSKKDLFFEAPLPDEFLLLTLF